MEKGRERRRGEEEEDDEDRCVSVAFLIVSGSGSA